MATGGSGRVYEEDDVLDERLLNQISKWIMYHRLPSLARHLGISDAEISRIMIPSRTPEEQCFRIIKRWHERKFYKVKDLIEAMVEWQNERYIDPGIWENLIHNKVNPALMPVPSVLRSLPLSPGGSHDALQRLPHPAEGARHLLEAQYKDWRTVLHEAGILRRRVFVEETVRLSEEHLETSGQPDIMPENVPTPTSSSVPEILPSSISSKSPDAVPLPGSSSASNTFTAPGSSSVPETVPVPTSSSVPEIVPAPTSSSLPETAQVPLSSCTPETVPAPVSSNAPETTPVRVLSSALMLPSPSSSSNPESLANVQESHPASVGNGASTDFTHLQKKLRISLHRTWKNALTLDWISPDKAKSLPLLEFYTELRWTKMVEALKNYKVELNNIYDILKIVNPNEELRPINIFIGAEPGMGKTCSLALLALKWVSGHNVPFDLVFLIRLRYVKRGLSLAEIIKKQHDGLKQVSSEYIECVLEGETNHKVLLMLDGYDEYKPGTNEEIDESIESTKGKCCLILTSRTGDYLRKSIRDKMDGEIVIEGFSEENIKLCSTKYLESEERSRQMLEQAKKTGIDVLLHIPIILIMTVVVFIQEESLPKTKTGIYETIFRLTMDRTTLKTFGCKSANISDISELLYALGELSWNALQNDVQQLLLKKEKFEAHDPHLLKLGLLYEVGVDAATVLEPETLLSFQHKSLQEFSSSKHLAKRLDNIMTEGKDVKETLKELFPSWEDVKDRYREVIIFTVGLMKDPRPLVQFTYEMCIEKYLKEIRTGDGDPIVDQHLFKALYNESAVQLSGHPLHNKYMNHYSFSNTTSKTTFFPLSKIYEFHAMRDDVTWLPEHPEQEAEMPHSEHTQQEAEMPHSEHTQQKAEMPHSEHTQQEAEIPDPEHAEQEAEIPEHVEQEAEMPECAMVIYKPNKAVVNSLLSTCCQISQHQAVTDFCVWEIRCEGDCATAEAPVMSRESQSLTLYDCVLPAAFVRNILRQLFHCGGTLRSIVLEDIDLSEAEDDLDELLEHIVSYHKKGLAEQNLRLRLGGGIFTSSNLSGGFVRKWERQCREISSIKFSIIDD